MTSFEPTSPPPRTWDFLLTVIAIIIEVLLGIVLIFSAIALSLANQGCDTTVAACDPGRVQFGLLLATWGAPLIGLVTAVVGIVRVLRRKLAFWIPLLGIVLMAGAFLLGTVIIDL